MKYTLAILISPLAFYWLSGNSTHPISERPKKFVKIEYTGDVSKPYPVVILYTPGAKNADGDNLFSEKIKISEIQYVKIKSLIMAADYVRDIDSTFEYPYQFDIIEDSAQIFRTRSVSAFKKICASIEYELRDKGKRDRFKLRIESTLSRLRSENQLQAKKIL